MNITPALILVISAFLPTVLFLIVYLLQTKQKNARTTVFYMILITNFYLVLAEIVNGYILHNINEDLGLWILRTQWADGTLEFYACFIYNYIIFCSVSDTTKFKDLFKNKLFTAFSIFSILYVIAELFVPVMDFETGIINFRNFPNMYVAMLYAVMVLIIGVVMFFKKKNRTKVDYALLITEAAVAAVYGGLQTLMPDVALSPFLNVANILMMYMIIENPDIIISKELEEVQKENEKRTKTAVHFSSSMKKDLIYRVNTIKNTLIKYKENGVTGEELAQKNEKLIHEIKLLTSKISNITGIILSNEVDTHPVEIDVNKFLERFFELSSNLINKQNISYKINIMGSTPTNIRVDTEYLYYSVLNQFLNALDATEIGEISFTVSGESTVDGNYLVFKCNDTGKGYSQDELKNISDIIASKDSIELSNIYLATLSEMKNNHNGDFSIESFEGAGSITTVKIDYEKVDDSHISDRAITKAEVENKEIFDCNRLKALILGEPGKRSDDILKLYNIDVDKTTSSKEALNLIKKGNKYEWFLININHEDAIAAGKAIKKLNKEYGYSMPYIVAIIPYKNKNFRMLITESGVFNDYIIEPLELVDLNTVLRKTRRK